MNAISVEPDPTPRDGIWWSIPQAIIWIFNRNKSTVERVASLTTIASLNQITGLLPFMTGDAPPLSLGGARTELLRAACAEQISIWGEKYGYGFRELELVPVHALHNPGLTDINGLNECMPCILESKQPLQPGRAWTARWVRIEECISRWPGSASAAAPTPKENGQQRPLKPTAERMGLWYRQRVADHDESQPPPTRPEDEKAAKIHFKRGGLKDLVRAARNEYAPVHWRESGPKGHKAKAHAARASATQLGQK